jgi:hypothetical protein
VEKELCELEAVALHETDKGLLICRLEDFDEDNRKIPKDKKYWLPKSQIHDNSEVWKNGDSGVLVIPLWLAEQAGLE